MHRSLVVQRGTENGAAVTEQPEHCNAVLCLPRQALGFCATFAMHTTTTTITPLLLLLLLLLLLRQQQQLLLLPPLLVAKAVPILMFVFFQATGIR